MRVGAADGSSVPAVAGILMDVGGFVMEQKMMQGIALRAGGGSEPAYGEALEIAIWLSTLAIGLMAAWLFVRRRAWQWPLAVGVAAALALVVLTVVQPPLWARVALDLALLAGLWRAGRREQPYAQMNTAMKPA
jgi:hypothetical protein